MCMLGVNGDYVGKAPSSGYAGYTLAIGDDGKPAWIPNVPAMRNGHFQARSSPGLGIKQYILKSGNGGSNAEAVTTGKYPGSVAHSTGTNTNGYAGRQCAGATGFLLAGDTATWYYETVFRIPTLSDGTDTFAIALGSGDVTTAVDHANGFYLRYSSAANSGKFELVTAKASVRTSTDTGVAAVANTWYHALIVVTGDTSISLYLVADGSDLGSAVATNTTNIPLVDMGLNSIILKSAGTNARTVEVCYELARRQTAFTPTAAARWSHPGRLTMGDGVGFATGDVASGLHLNRNAEAIWNAICLPCDMHRYNAEEIAGLDGDFADSLVAAGSTGNAALDSGYMATYSCSSVSGATDAAMRIAGRLYLDADSGTITYEAVFFVTTLSTAAQKHTVRIGLPGASQGATDGVMLSIDSDADTEAQFVTLAGGSATTTDTGVTIGAGTYYHLKIVVTNNTTVSCYLKAAGTVLGAAVATHTTNIPSAYLTPGGGLIKTNGTTSRSVRFAFQRCFQRMASVGTGLG